MISTISSISLPERKAVAGAEDRPQHASLRWTGLALIVALACDGGTPPQAQSVTDGISAARLAPDVHVDSTTRFQTIHGWEATAWAGQWACGEGDAGEFPAVFHTYKGEMLRRLVEEVGITRIRLEVRSGAENPHDYFADFRARRNNVKVYEQHYYTTVNDNDDPHVIDPAGFHFSEMDFAIDNVVEPLRALLQARGERLYVNLNLVQFGREGALLREQPEEYAEFMLATFQHLQAKYGWVPDGVEIILEPDNSNRPRGTHWPGRQIGRAMVAAAVRLQAHGFQPEFIGPSTVRMNNAPRFFDEMMEVPEARGFITELSYHRYGTLREEVQADALRAIADRASRFGVRTSMLERIGSGYEQLHADLEHGMVSAWAQYAIGGCNTSDAGGRHFLVDVTRNATQPPIILAGRSHFLRQYFSYVRPGAVRIAATSEQPALAPLAFINSDGRFVVVMKATQNATFRIGGLPAGTYSVVYTTGPNQQRPARSGVVAPDVTIGDGDTLDGVMPGRGVITIFAKPPAR